jgi:ABC-type multidrug transport system ATPase subunit
MMNGAIAVHEATVALGGQTLLPPVTFAVASGRALAVVGPNGSGKTTLLRLLAGLVRPSSGSVSVGGDPPDERQRAFRRRLAALIGTPPLARNLTLREHLILVGASWGRDLNDAGRHADALLAELEVAALAERFPHELSSGQAQLFALALTLARPCAVLLLDEPEQRLDADRLGLVVAALRRRAADGVTLVVASHHLRLVDEVADEVLPIAEANPDQSPDQP